MPGSSGVVASTGAVMSAEMAQPVEPATDHLADEPPVPAIDQPAPIPEPTEVVEVASVPLAPVMTGQVPVHATPEPLTVTVAKMNEARAMFADETESSA